MILLFKTDYKFDFSEIAEAENSEEASPLSSYWWRALSAVIDSKSIEPHTGCDNSGIRGSFNRSRAAAASKITMCLHVVVCVREKLTVCLSV